MRITAPATKTLVTILTGFLGAGKTTLLNRILAEPHGHRIAVIENEFGPEGIDGEILVQNTEEQIVEMNNGCLCCTIRGDLARILNGLVLRRANGEIVFDRVIIETTGMADPGPVLQTFLLDAAVAKNFALDGVVTVVDALHGPYTLDHQVEGQAQVGYADRLLVSKTDLVTPVAADRLRDRLRRINPNATITPVHFGRAPIAELLEISGFEARSVPTVASSIADETRDRHEHHDHHHDHGDEIGAFAVTTSGAFEARRLEHLFAVLAEGYGADLLRYKGIINVDGQDQRIILQGVQLVINCEMGAVWRPDEPRTSRLVFIGRNLDPALIEDSLRRCLVPEPVG